MAMQTLFEGKVQVWVERAEEHLDISDLEALLDERERVRAGKFVRDPDRRNFILAHGLKRKCLGKLLGINPSALRFGTYSSGKPYLMDTNVHFNLSHSHGVVALAASEFPCGIDIEAYRDLNHLPLLIEKTMTANEQDLIRQASSPQRAFIDRWVIKEAFLKLSGIGLGLPLASLCTASEMQSRHHDIGTLRGAALFSNSGNDYSLAVSHGEVTDLDLKVSYGGIPLMQRYA